MIALCEAQSNDLDVGVSMDLMYAVGQLDRQVPNVESLLSLYLKDVGLRYLDYEPVTPKDRLVPEDLAVTILVNSRVAWRAFASVQDKGPGLDFSVFPDKPLAQTTESERQRLADLIAEIAQWPGLAASVATKVLHKKRPSLIPILDNQAIFGAYMNPKWPEQRSWTDSVYASSTIRKALDWITADLTSPQNAQAWAYLHTRQPERSRVQLFDMVWWAYFRKQEPVKAAPTV
jgi:hypothetical protein